MMQGLREGSDTNRLIGMLGTLLSDKLSPQEKEEVLEREYNIETTVKRKEEINSMCNLSDLIEERGIRKGVEQGIEQGIEQERA